MLLNYFRRLKLSTKIMIFSLFSYIVIFVLYIFFNFLFYGLLKTPETPERIQFFTTLEILGQIPLLLFIIFGFHFLLSQLVNLPYNDYKLEIATAILFTLNFLLFVPTTFTVQNFQLSPSIKLLLDTTYMLTGSIYMVLAMGVYYMTFEKDYLNRRYARWSILFFFIIFSLLALETVRRSMETAILVTFTLVNLLLLLSILVKDIKILIDSNLYTKENKLEIAIFLILITTVVVGKGVHLFLTM